MLVEEEPGVLGRKGFPPLPHPLLLEQSVRKRWLSGAGVVPAAMLVAAIIWNKTAAGHG